MASAIQQFSSNITQMGYSSLLVADSWTDTGATTGTASPIAVGISIEFSALGTEPERSLPIDPPIVRPASLTLTPQTAVSGTFSQSIWAVPQATPALYSNSDPPLGRSETVAEGVDANLICTVNLEAGDQTANQPFTFEFGKIYTSGSGWAESSTLRSNLDDITAKYYRVANWNGRMCFTTTINNIPISNVPIYYTQLETTTAYRPTMSAYYADFNTGHAISGVGHRARAIHCARSGLPAMSDQLVEDGWTEGLYVLPEWAEPEDRAEILANIPDSEGTTDDIPGF